MKKFLICTSVVGVVIGVGYLSCKKAKTEATVNKTVINKGETESNYENVNNYKEDYVIKDVSQIKDEQVQSVIKRHSDAGKMMRDAYQDIMEDFVEDFSKEDVMKKQEDVYDSEADSVIKDIDNISDELDDLLK